MIITKRLCTFILKYTNQHSKFLLDCVITLTHNFTYKYLYFKENKLLKVTIKSN